MARNESVVVGVGEVAGAYRAELFGWSTAP